MMPDPWATHKRPSAVEGQTTTSAPPQTASCASADKGTVALTRKFHGARPRSAARDVEVNTVVGETPAGKGQNPEAPGAREHEARCLAAMSRAMAIERRGTAAPFKTQKKHAWEFFQRQSGLETERKRRIREEVRT